MIRDHSDGSVKPPLTPEAIEVLKREARKPPGPAMDHEGTRKFMMGEIPSTGLPPLSQSEGERLRRSRDQLENWRKTGVWK